MTFQHSKSFIEYHADKYEDFSILISAAQEPVAYLLAARDTNNYETVISHPGAAFSGLVTSPQVKGEDYINLLRSVKSYFESKGFNTLIYKDTPQIYCEDSKGDFVYAAFRNDVAQHIVQLSSVIDLKKSRSFSSRRRRVLKKYASRLKISNNWSNLDLYWQVLTNNLHEKYEAQPVHTLQEIQLLKGLFEDSIELFTVTSFENAELLAGILVFKSSRVWKTQYISSTPAGREIGSVDFLISQIIEIARENNVDYVDLGTNNEKSGLVLNGNLYQYKSEFGAEGVAYEQFKFNLKQ